MGSQRAQWETRLEREHGNLRAALQWAHEREDAQLGLELVGNLYRFWERHGHMRDGYAWLRRFLSTGAEVTAPVMAPAMRAGSTLALRLGDDVAAMRYGEASLGMYQAQGDVRGIDATLGNLAHIAWYGGHLDRALELWEAGLALLRSSSQVDETTYLGCCVTPVSGMERAIELLTKTAGIRRQMPDNTHWLALTLVMLGDLGRRTGQPDRAQAWFEDALEIFGNLSATAAIVTVRSRLADVTRDRGDYESAIAEYQESLRTLIALRDRSAASCVEGIAACAASLGQESCAARLYGAAAAIRETFGRPALHPHRSEHEGIIQRLRPALGSAAFTEAWSAGTSLSFEDAVSEALGKTSTRS